MCTHIMLNSREWAGVCEIPQTLKLLSNTLKIQGRMELQRHRVVQQHGHSMQTSQPVTKKR